MFPAIPYRHSLEEWYNHHEKRYRINCNQQIVADRVIAESNLVKDGAEDIILKNKRETEHLSETRKADIEFEKKEIECQRNDLGFIQESLEAYLTRLKNTRDFFNNDVIPNCKKCQEFRENRYGIDLCNDNVDKQLLIEIDLYRGAERILSKTIERTEIQIERCKDVIHHLDLDLKDKEIALKIEGDNLDLKDTNIGLRISQQLKCLTPPNIKYQDWEIFSKNIISQGKKEVALSRELLTYIDSLLIQVSKDSQYQYDKTNDAFRERISELKYLKQKFENQHFDVTQKVSEMKENISNLQKAITDKEGYLALAQQRLENRSHRPRIEFCKDSVESSLITEIKHLRQNVAFLRIQIFEAETALRYLAKTQLELTEEINIKANSIKIDEVDCMTIRQSIDFHKY